MRIIKENGDKTRFESGDELSGYEYKERQLEYE